MNTLPLTQKVAIIAALVEGCSIRSTERLIGVHRDTVMRLGIEVGEACARLHRQRVRDVDAPLIQCDEIWSYVGKKQGHLAENDSPEWGDWYTFIGFDALTKLVIAYRVDRRTAPATTLFAQDLRDRVLGKPQITTDGFAPYVDAIERAFGVEVHFATAVKVFEGDPNPTGEAARRYSPGRLRAVEKRTIIGHPIDEHASTSLVERNNLTLRMHLRRFTRLTNAYSKRVRNLRAAISLHVAWYNFVRVHETIRVTPAMQAGLTDHVWSIAELIEASLTATNDGPPVQPAVASVPPVLRVIQGGRQ
jgi:IS1 family transposase